MSISIQWLVTFLFLLVLLCGIRASESGEARIELPFTFSNETQQPHAHPETIRICTWNLEWFPAGQRQSQDQQTRWQVAATVSILEEIKPDILVTQETRNLSSLRLLNRNLNPPGFSHMASTLYYKENIEANLGNHVRQENGLMSRYPWNEIFEIDFGGMKGKSRPTRGWLYARFDIGSYVIHLYNGHLKSNFGADKEEDRLLNISKRSAAIKQLQLDLNRRKLDPYRDRIVVAGDMNSDFFSAQFSDEQLFSELERMGFRHTFLMVPAEQRITVPSREGEPWPDSVFDYIFISSGCKAGDLSAQVLQKGASKRKDVFGGDEPGLASDHYPVFIDLPLK